jgi:signal transduction histidine kinase
MNLIGNAYKFTPKGYIEILLEEDTSAVKCSVKDTGIGIDPKDLPRLFSKFEQIGRQSTPGMKGTGLGLVIAKQIVERHGGWIKVESVPQEGTKFIFTLPRYNN